MKWTEIASGQTNGAFQRFMVALGDKAEVAVTRINKEPVFVDRLASFASNGTVERSTSQKRARKIMDSNLFGVEEAIQHFGVNPSRRQIASLSQISFDEDVLEECQDTHLLVSVFPMSILGVRGKVERNLFYSHDDAWYNKQAFANDNGEIGWQLIRKEPIANSTSKTWYEQQALLSQDEEVPKAQVMVYSIIGHYLATGERLFESLYVRCSDLDSDGSRVYVGYFGTRGLDVDYCSDDCRSVPLGLAAARK